MYFVKKSYSLVGDLPPRYVRQRVSRSLAGEGGLAVHRIRPVLQLLHDGLEDDDQGNGGLDASSVVLGHAGEGASILLHQSLCC